MPDQHNAMSSRQIQQIIIHSINGHNDSCRSYRSEGFCSSSHYALSCFLKILFVDLCCHLIHAVNAEGWTVLLTSYQTLASCISVREEALSHLALSSVHHRLVKRSQLTICKNGSLFWIGHLVTEVLVLFTSTVFLFFFSEEAKRLEFACHNLCLLLCLFIWKLVM